MNTRQGGCPTAVLVKAQQLSKVDIANAIAVGHEEVFVGPDVLANACESTTGHGFGTRVDEADAPVGLVVNDVVFDDLLGSKRNREVAIQQVIVDEVVLDQLALVAEAQH